LRIDAANAGAFARVSTQTLYAKGVYIDEYDHATGLYFKSVETGINESGFLSKGPSDDVSDINIFNPSTGKSALIFNDKKPRKIVAFIYESQYQAETRSMIFGSDEERHNRYIKNNHSIEERKPKDRLLLVAYNKDQETYDMWSLNKSGENLKKLITINRTIDWHIDVKNSKIRFFALSENGVEIKSLDW